jgi:plastocyanin
MRLRTILAACALLALASACSSDDPSAPPPCDAPEAVTSVTTGEFFYEPVCVEASNGTTLEVVNDGDAPHTFTVKDVDLEADLGPHDTGELALDGLTAGTVYLVTCKYHSNMTAALKAV